MPRRSLPPGRISVEQLADRAQISRRQVEYWIQQGWLDHTKEESGGRSSRVHFDPSEVRVAFAIKVLIRMEYDMESFLLAIKRVREWEDPQEYFEVAGRIYLDFEDI